MDEESDEERDDDNSEIIPNGNQTNPRISSNISQNNKNDFQNNTPDYSRLASISAKLDISDSTRQMEEVLLLLLLFYYYFIIIFLRIIII